MHHSVHGKKSHLLTWAITLIFSDPVTPQVAFYLLVFLVFTCRNVIITDDSTDAEHNEDEHKSHQ